MIKIVRTPEPSILRTSRAKERYTKPQVRDTLWNMQHGKCCYCERNLDTEGSNQQVEHYRPRKRYPTLKNEWTNLLLACGRCNQKKLDNFPTYRNGRPLVLDPSAPQIDPETHITFLVGGDTPTQLIGKCEPLPGSRRGKVTIAVIDLHGEDHVRDRYRHYRNTLLAWLQNLNKAMEAADQVSICAAQEKLRELMSAKSALAGFVREWARREELEKLGVAIPSGAEGV